MTAEGPTEDQIARLRGLYSVKPSFKLAFDSFASLQRDRKMTAVDYLLTVLRRADPSTPRADVIELYKQLENCGCGWFIRGRKGHPSRFEWKVSRVWVGKVASGSPTSLEPIPTDDEVEANIEVGFLEHTFLLRPNTEIRLQLPADLTTRESERLSEFIKALPFEPSQLRAVPGS